QHQKMVVAISLWFSAMVLFFTDVKLAADDRLDASFFGGIHKMHCAKDVAVIGHSHGRHSEFLRPFTEQLDVAGSVEHGVIGMQMEMDELSWSSGHRHPVSVELSPLFYRWIAA